ncbi:uncharacterized protein LOC9641076 [Selaginella moellendorffii]|uniref:uncharacterized protein LOC9641076 n=1 Tax=Selaginella moellendorffii TaxID=88036 RepID=UPI000D1CF98C|nr:uncharacterized protein LOC9641076 [Selaginella moellendorffii]|eukprot:XP_024523770.1 uncharacterized protein LOC9641076 [Selaginella moellendorffii]
MDSSKLRLVSGSVRQRSSTPLAPLSQCLRPDRSTENPRVLIRASGEILASQQQGHSIGQQLLAPPPPSPARQIPRELDPLRMPEHVAIIMDGNSRWAKLRGLATDRGHEAGVHALREIVAASSRLGIKTLTVFAFSTENWRRPTDCRDPD